MDVLPRADLGFCSWRCGAMAAANEVVETSASQIITASIDSVNLVDGDLPLLLLWRRS
jgi:hypothetical protein